MNYIATNIFIHASCVRVFQKNRTSSVHIYTHIQKEREREWLEGGEIYYKELAYAIMEANKSQDVQLASWRPRRAEREFRSEDWQVEDPGRANDVLARV